MRHINSDPGFKPGTIFSHLKAKVTREFAALGIPANDPRVQTEIDSRIAIEEKSMEGSAVIAA